MIARRQKIMLLLLTLLLLVAGSGWPKPAAAQGIPVTPTNNASSYWARWIMEMDFTDNQVNARWTVFVGLFDPQGQMFIKDQKTETINCTPIGNVKIDQEEAYFDGASYLSCAVPSFYDAVQALFGTMPFNPELFNNQYCKCKNPQPWVAADLTLFEPRGASPLVYQVDNAMQFNITQSNNIATSHLLLNDGAPVPTQLDWPINFDIGNQLWSGSGAPNFLLMTDPNWYQFLSSDFYNIAQKLSLGDYFHWADTVPQGSIFTHETDFLMTNQATTFLVGYNGQTYFTGKIRKLAWDPPCVPKD